MRLLLTIIAHGKASETFRRHRPFWEQHKTQIEVWTPEDDPIGADSCYYPVFKSGLAGHFGPQAHKRLKEMLNHLASTSATHHFICEYDSFSLSPIINLNDGFGCNLLPNGERHKYFGKFYGHPPWLIDRGTLHAMVATMRQHPNIYEDGYADRFLSALALLSGAKLYDYTPKGYSCANIDLPELACMKKDIEAGGTMIHGVKTAWVMEAAWEFYRTRNP